MATFLDIGLIQYFDVIFTVLLVFALVFATLKKTKILGESNSIAAIVSVAVSFLVLLSNTVMEMVKFMTPWFAIAIIFFILVILVFQVFGAGEKDIYSAVKDPVLRWTIIGVAIVILVAGFGHVLGQSLTEAAFQSGETVNATAEGGSATVSFEQNVNAIIFNPKVLGLMILFAVAIFAIAFLSGG